MKIITYNAGLLEYKIFGLCLFRPTPFIEERLAHLPTTLEKSGADVVLLQEVYSLNHKKFLVKMLKEIYPYSYYEHEGYKFAMENSLMVFSKSEFSNPSLYIFKNSFLEEKIFGKLGVLNFNINKDGQQYTIYNVHLTAGGLRGPEHRESEQVRDKQIDELLELVDDSPSINNIFAGDLNCGENVSAKNYQKLINNNLVNVHDDSVITWCPKNPLNNTGIHKHCPPQGIDHILVPKTIKNKIKAGGRALFTDAHVPTRQAMVTTSDHYAISCELL